MNCHTMGNPTLSLSPRWHCQQLLRVFWPCPDTLTHLINMSLKEILNRCTPKVRVIRQLIHDLHGQVHKRPSLPNTYAQHDSWFIDNMHMVYFRIPLEIPIPWGQVLLTFFSEHIRIQWHIITFTYTRGHYAFSHNINHEHIHSFTQHIITSFHFSNHKYKHYASYYHSL